MDLYFITHRPYADVISSVKAAINGGVKIIQYREKEKNYPLLKQTALEIKELCNKNNVIFIINDYLDLAIEIDADGVHLGQDDGDIEEAQKRFPDKIIGRSTHNLKQAIEAEKEGADYIGVGPIYGTVTHQNPESDVGIELLRKIKETVKLPVVALGSIDKNNILQVLSTGTKTVAMLRSLLTAEDIENEIKEIRKIINNTRTSNIKEHL